MQTLIFNVLVSLTVPEMHIPVLRGGLLLTLAAKGFAAVFRAWDVGYVPPFPTSIPVFPRPQPHRSSYFSSDPRFINA